MTWDDFEKKLFSTIAVLPACVTRFRHSESYYRVWRMCSPRA